MLDYFLFNTTLFWIGLFVISMFIFAADEFTCNLVFALVVFFLIFGYGIIAALLLITARAAFTYVGVYLAAGFLLALYKWWQRRRGTKEAIDLFKKRAAAGDDHHILYEINTVLERLNPALNKNLISFWVIFWPWVFITSAIRDATDLVYLAVRSLFEKLAAPAASELNKFKEEIVVQKEEKRV